MNTGNPQIDSREIDPVGERVYQALVRRSVGVVSVSVMQLLDNPPNVIVRVWFDLPGTPGWVSPPVEIRKDIEWLLGAVKAAYLSYGTPYGQPSPYGPMPDKPKTMLDRIAELIEPKPDPEKPKPRRKLDLNL